MDKEMYSTLYTVHRLEKNSFPCRVLEQKIKKKPNIFVYNKYKILTSVKIKFQRIFSPNVFVPALVC